MVMMWTMLVLHHIHDPPPTFVKCSGHMVASWSRGLLFNRAQRMTPAMHMMPQGHTHASHQRSFPGVYGIAIADAVLRTEPRPCYHPVQCMPQTDLLDRTQALLPPYLPTPRALAHSGAHADL
jgi:hypothetical protein